MAFIFVKDNCPAGVIPDPDLRGVVPDARVTEIRRVPFKSAPGDARWKVWELTVDRTIFTGPGRIRPYFAGSVADVGAVAGAVVADESESDVSTFLW